MGFVIAFQVRDKATVLILLIMFLRSISFRSEKSSSVVAVLNSHLQRSTCESSKYRTVLLRLQEDKHSKPKSAQLRSRREIKSQLCSYCTNSHCGNYIGKVASVPVGFQPGNIASLVSNSIWNITDIRTPGRLSLVHRARASGGRCKGFKSMFNCHGVTFALLICF